jgi:phosphoribosyl 1,2-cyclic phosphodiesterase
VRLSFLGRLSAFSRSGGNTAAFYREDSRLLLIDCGERIFERILAHRILSCITHIYVVITHTHADHIGSLGSLLLYARNVTKQQVHLVVDPQVSDLRRIEAILEGFGVPTGAYDLVDAAALSSAFDGITDAVLVPTAHAPELRCQSLRLQCPEGLVYYTGDTGDAPAVAAVVAEQNLAALYVDTCAVDTKVHLSLRQLTELVPVRLRHKVYCMHLTDEDLGTRALDAHFRLAPTIEPPHPVLLRGVVTHGKGLGKTVGLPTANLDCGVESALGDLPWGVYAVRATVRGQPYLGVTNIGTRPTVDTLPLPTVETWLLDFNADIYGETVTLEVQRFLRPILRFPNLETVRTQVYEDAEEVRRLPGL